MLTYVVLFVKIKLQNPPYKKTFHSIFFFSSAMIYFKLGIPAFALFPVEKKVIKIFLWYF